MSPEAGFAVVPALGGDFGLVDDVRGLTARDVAWFVDFVLVFVFVGLVATAHSPSVGVAPAAPLRDVRQREPAHHLPAVTRPAEVLLPGHRFPLSVVRNQDKFSNEKSSPIPLRSSTTVSSTPSHSPEPPDLDAQIARFTEACRERGMSMTHQRLAIFRALLQSESHPDAEALHRSLRGTIPTLALGTVYKTLEMLQSLGMARPVSSPGPTRRFDGKQHPHHHLWCTHCQRLMDVELDGLADIALPAGQDFQVTNITIQFNGSCADCRPRDPHRVPAPRSIPHPTKGAPR